MFANVLFLPEKLVLRLRAWHDARNGALQAFSPGAANEVSPFAAIEMSKFIARRDAVLNETVSLFSFQDPGSGRTIRIMGFPKAIEWIREKVNELEAEIMMIDVRLRETVQNLEAKQQDALRQNAEHLVQLYANKIHEARDQFQRDTAGHYKAIIALLGQKLRLVRSVRTRIVAIRSRQFLRIRYYHAQLCRYAQVYQMDFPGDDELAQLCGDELPEYYRRELEESQEKLDDIMHEVKSVTVHTPTQKSNTTKFRKRG